MRILVGCFFLALGLATPANADWQYTKWGMTPTEVVAASGGHATCKQPSTKELANTLSYVDECNSWYQVGKFKFFVTFSFDKQFRKLQGVTLLLVGSDEDDLAQAIQEKYGPWTDGTVWLDKAAGYSVRFKREFGAWIHYHPLHEAEKGGL
jgi:hypothetical protein